MLNPVYAFGPIRAKTKCPIKIKPLRVGGYIALLSRHFVQGTFYSGLALSGYGRPRVLELWR